jgi:hypothetical protein
MLLGFGGGRIASVPNTFELVTSVSAILSVHAATDVIVDDDTLGVTVWQDRTGNARHYNNLGADSTLPLWSSTGGPGGKPSVSGDGAARFIKNANWNPPAPGTTAMYWRAIARLNAWGASNRHLWGGLTASRLALRTVASSPQMACFNVTQGPTVNMTVGTWFRVEAYYSNSTGDFLKIGSAQTTIPGTNVGNNDQTEHALFSITPGTGGNCLDASMAKLEIFAGLPMSAERDAMDASDTAYFGAGAVTF